MQNGYKIILYFHCVVQLPSVIYIYIIYCDHYYFIFVRLKIQFYLYESELARS